MDILHAVPQSSLVPLCGVITALTNGSSRALKKFGPSFLYEERWTPVTEKFGGAAMCGSLVTSIIAMTIAIPLGFLIALSLARATPCRDLASVADLCPRRPRLRARQ